MRASLAFFAAALCAVNAHAADLTVRVVDGAGAPVENAVVTFTPNGGVTTPFRFDWAYQVAQQNLQFEPYILIVPVGATVRFPNLDRVRHHVYSFSEGNRFELELFGRDESRSHRFSRAGIAAVGCNIHDQMQAYIVIVDTPFVGRTTATGAVRISGASGAGALRVWHPNLRARGGAVSRAVTLPASGAAQESFTVELRPASHAH
jgi:hypothetical protein